MNQFEFLSLFVVIIITLGISNILSSAMRLIRRRGHVRIHYTTLVWMAVLFLLQMLIWWESFQRREWAHWTFFRFLLYLMMPVLVSVPGYLLVPDQELEREPDYDLATEFDHNRQWFFALLAAAGVISFVEYLLISSPPRFGLNSAFPLEILLFSIGGFFFKAKWIQLLIALAFLVTLLCYIGFVFSRL